MELGSQIGKLSPTNPHSESAIGSNKTGSPSPTEPPEPSMITGSYAVTSPAVGTGG
jgi:hypothetical protein